MQGLPLPLEIVQLLTHMVAGVYLKPREGRRSIALGVSPRTWPYSKLAKPRRGDAKSASTRVAPSGLVGSMSASVPWACAHGYLPAPLRGCCFSAVLPSRNCYNY